MPLSPGAKRAPFWKFSPVWWVSHPGIAAMTPAQETALIRLLSFAWGDGSAPPRLPNVPADLAVLSKLGAAWEAESPAVLRFFEEDREGYLYNPEQMEAYQDMQDRHARRVAAGTAGGTAKARNRSPDAPPKPPRVAVTEAEWEACKAAYPARQGGQDWRGARIGYTARRRSGAPHAVILAGVERYAAYCRALGKLGTPFVKAAATFFGPGEHYLESWAVESPSPTSPPGRPTRPGAGARQRAALAASFGGSAHGD